MPKLRLQVQNLADDARILQDLLPGIILATAEAASLESRGSMKTHIYPTSELFDRPQHITHRRVYHVSPAVLVQAIAERGILPYFANGALKVSYWCEKTSLLWALAHISAVKAISVDQLSIWQASIWRGALGCTRSPGVYTCKFQVLPNKCYPAIEAFTWLNSDGSLVEK